MKHTLMCKNSKKVLLLNDHPIMWLIEKSVISVSQEETIASTFFRACHDVTPIKEQFILSKETK